jgi:BolA protein
MDYDLSAAARQDAHLRARPKASATVASAIDTVFPAKLNKFHTEADMSAETRLRDKLIIALEPTRLDIVNESELHAGHRNSPDTGESHFRVLIVSPKFQGVSRVGRHRMVNEAIADELTRIHALALSTYAPGEALT